MMNEDYPEKPPGLSPTLKARQGFIRLDSHGGQIGNVEWSNGDPAGCRLQMPQADGSVFPIRFFGSIGWCRYGWPITGYADDVAWVAQAAVRRFRYLQMEG